MTPQKILEFARKHKTTLIGLAILETLILVLGIIGSVKHSYWTWLIFLLMASLFSFVGLCIGTQEFQHYLERKLERLRKNSEQVIDPT